MSFVPQCTWCRHNRSEPGKSACAAFAEGIPEAILRNEHDHRQPFEGDHGVRFEPAADVDPAWAEEFMNGSTGRPMEDDGELIDTLTIPA